MDGPNQGKPCMPAVTELLWWAYYDKAFQDSHYLPLPAASVDGNTAFANLLPEDAVHHDILRCIPQKLRMPQQTVELSVSREIMSTNFMAP